MNEEKLVWTTNGDLWLAMHRTYWALIEKTIHARPFRVTCGSIDVSPASINTYYWNSGEHCISLEDAKAWAERKLG